MKNHPPISTPPRLKTPWPHGLCRDVHLVEPREQLDQTFSVPPAGEQRGLLVDQGVHQAVDVLEPSTDTLRCDCYITLSIYHNVILYTYIYMYNIPICQDVSYDMYIIYIYIYIYTYTHIYIYMSSGHNYMLNLMPCTN